MHSPIAQLDPTLDVDGVRRLLLNCSEQYVYELVAAGRLRASRIGRKLLFKTTDVLALLDEQPARTADGGATSFRARPKKRG